MKKTSYFCEQCNTYNKLSLDEVAISKYAEDSPNGLFNLTVRHKCNHGLTKSHNLQIDAGAAIRTLTKLEFPPMKTGADIGLVGLPKPGTQGVNQKGYKVLKMGIVPFLAGFEFELRMDTLRAILQTNNNPTNHPLSLIVSKMGMIEFELKSSIRPFTPMMEQWFQLLVDTIEILPPLTLGLLLDVLEYIMEYISDPPREFDRMMIQTMLVAHEIHFQIKFSEDLSSKLTMIEKKLTGITNDDIRMFFTSLTDSPDGSLQEIYAMFPYTNLQTLIYLFLIFEKEDIILIDKPGIVQ